MNLDYTAELSIRNLEVLSFLCDSNAISLEHKTPDPEGFETPHLAPTRFYGQQDEITFDFPVETLWHIVRKGKLLAKRTTYKFCRLSCVVQSGTCLFVSKGLEEEQKEAVADLFRRFDPSLHGSDAEAWISLQLPPGTSTAGIRVHGTWAMTKQSAVVVIDDSDERALKNAYTEDSVVILSESDSSLSRYCREMEIELIRVSQGPGNSFPQQENPMEGVNEIPKGSSKAARDEIIAKDVEEDLLNVPSVCGKMRPEERKTILTWGGWPEFKTEIHSRNVQIGCIVVSIYYPVFFRRDAQFIAYGVFSIPENSGQAAVNIAIHCAAKAALTTGVIAVVIPEPISAGAVFAAAFKQCVYDDLGECIFAKLVCTTEATSEWNQIL